MECKEKRLVAPRFYKESDVQAVAEEQKDKIDVVCVNKEMFLDYEFMSDISKHFQGKGLTVFVPSNDWNQNILFDNDEISMLIYNKQLFENAKMPVYFLTENKPESSDGYSIDEIIEVSKKINAEANRINNMIFSDRKLTPLEKFVEAYNYVLSFETDYKFSDSLTEDIVDVLKTNTIKHTGHAVLLDELCKRIGITSMKQSYCLQENGEVKEEDVGLNCMVYLEDSLYGVSGSYVSQPQKDAEKFGFGKTVCNQLMTLNEYYKTSNEILSNHTNINMKTLGEFLNKTKLFEEEQEFSSEQLASMFYDEPLVDEIIDALCDEIDYIDLEILEAEREEVHATLTEEERLQNQEDIFNDMINYFFIYSKEDDEESRANVRGMLLLFYANMTGTVDDLKDFLREEKMTFDVYGESIEIMREAVKDARIKMLYPEYAETLAYTKPVDMINLFEACVITNMAQGKTNEEANEHANKLFKNSVEYVKEFWNKNAINNYFSKEAFEKE